MSCPYCNKKGLPILPVRYAVGRADIGNAPALSAPFGTGITDIALPKDIGRYTLRLLRSGYLYMFDEARAEWSAYIVTNEGNLFEFDPKAGSAPSVPADSKPCERGSDPYIARCVTVKDAEHASKVWLAISDVQWTPAVLAHHAAESYRQKHMRCIDVGAWAQAAADQPHATSFEAFTKHVAEFAITPAQDGPVKAPAGIAAELKLTAYRTFGFSPYSFTALGDKGAALKEWAISVSKPHKAMIVALDDPGAIITELNELAKILSRAWVEDPVRRDKYASAMMIESVRSAVGDNAQERDEKFQSQMDQANASWYSAKGTDVIRAGAAGLPTDQQKAMRLQYANDLDTLHGLDAPRSMQMRLSSLNMQYGARNLTPQETAQFQKDRQEIFDDARARQGYLPGRKNQMIEEDRKDAWNKYLGSYKANELDDYIKQYHKELEAYDKATIKPLDDAYLAWIGSSRLKQYVACVFDTADVGSGLAFLRMTYSWIVDAAGRAGSCDFFTAQLQEDPENHGSLFLRALVLNQDQLAKQWTAKFKDSGPNLPWADTVSKFYDGYKDVITKGAMGEIEGIFDGLAKYIYHLSGPVVTVLGKGTDYVTTLAAKKLLPQRLLVGLLNAVARHENPDLVLIDIRTLVSRKQAVNLLASQLAALSGKGAESLKSGIRQSPLFEADSPGESLRPYRGLILVDKTKARQLGTLSGAALKNEISVTLTPQDFDAAVSSSMRQLGNVEVKAGVVGLIISSWVAYCNYKEFGKARPGDVKAAAVKFGSAIGVIVGVLGETAGRVAENTAWGTTKLARPIVTTLFQIETKAGWFVFGGKLLGAIGAGIAAVLDVREGLELRASGHSAVGSGLILLGLAEGAIAAGIFLGLIVPGVGIIIGLILAAIGLLISYFKPDDLQKWLEKCRDFGTQERDKWFKSLDEQGSELKAMASEG